MKQVFYTLIFSSLALGIPVTQAQEQRILSLENNEHLQKQ